MERDIFLLNLLGLEIERKKYDLGDEEFHLALTTENYEEAYKKT